MDAGTATLSTWDASSDGCSALNPETRAAHDPPHQIGSYKIIEVLGAGGMGVVYLAAQDHPIRRRVALKVIKLGMDTKEVLARFKSEYQARQTCRACAAAAVSWGPLFRNPGSGGRLEVPGSSRIRSASSHAPFRLCGKKQSARRNRQPQSERQVPAQELCMG